MLLCASKPGLATKNSFTGFLNIWLTGTIYLLWQESKVRFIAAKSNFLCSSLSLLECAQEKWRGVGANWPHGLNEGSSHSAHKAQNSDLIPQAKRSGGSVSSQGLLLLCALWKFHAFKTQNLIDPPSFTFPIHPLGERRRSHDNPSFLFLNIFW